MIYTWLAPKFILPLHDKLTGQRTWHTVREMDWLQWLDPEQIEERVLHCLRSLLSHAQSKVPYYGRLFKQAEFEPNLMESLADLARIPPLTKKTVRQHYQGDLLAQGLPASRRQAALTSGSTSLPLDFYLDRQTEGRIRAALLHFRHQAGIDTHDAMLWLTHTPHQLAYYAHIPKWKRLVRRLLLGEIIHIGQGPYVQPAELDAFIEGLPASRSYFIFGFPSALSRLAKRLIDQHRTPAKAPKVVVAYAENLEPQLAAKLGRVFGCPVFNLYSSFEVRYIAQTCPDYPEFMHINPGRCWLRVVDENGQDCLPGQAGRVLVTDLYNRVMPIINYDLDDVAVLGAVCPCGRGFPTLSSVEGRVNETIHTLDGRIIASTTSNVFLYWQHNYQPYLWEHQFYQPSPYEVVLRVVPTERYDAEVEARLAADLQEFVGPSSRVGVQTMDTLPLGPSGKRATLICEVPDGD